MCCSLSLIVNVYDEYVVELGLPRVVKTLDEASLVAVPSNEPTSK